MLLSTVGWYKDWRKKGVHWVRGEFRKVLPKNFSMKLTELRCCSHPVQTGNFRNGEQGGTTGISVNNKVTPLHHPLDNWMAAWSERRRRTCADEWISCRWCTNYICICSGGLISSVVTRPPPTTTLAATISARTYARWVSGLIWVALGTYNSDNGRAGMDYVITMQISTSRSMLHASPYQNHNPTLNRVG